MAERILVGHFLTRRQAARRVNTAPRDVVTRPDLLRVGGTWLEEVYFAFQFSRDGVKHELARAVEELRREFDDEAIADWLVRPNPSLGSVPPLAWVQVGGDGRSVVEAARQAGPLPDDDEHIGSTSQPTLTRVAR